MLTPLLAAVVLSAGLSVSRGLGEQLLAPAVRAAYEDKAWRATASWEGSHKVESGQGWIAGADVDYGTRLTAGLSYRHRDGGTWVKRSWWPRLGLNAGPARLVIRQDISTRDSVSIAEVHLTKPGTVRVENVVGVTRYGRGEYGVFVQWWLGVGR